MNNISNKRFSKLFLLSAGIGLMVTGIVLVLLWWQDVMVVFRGFFGVMVALGGLFVLYTVKE